MLELRQSTGRDIRVGPAMESDGVTPVTNLTLTGADQAEVLKADGAATVDISGRTFAGVTDCAGWYDLTLTTADTGTLGELEIVVQDASLILPIFIKAMVVTAQYWDSKYGADTLQVDVTQVAGSAVAGVNDFKATGFSTHAAADVRTEMDANSTQLAAIVADTDELQTNQGNWLTATGFSTHSAADVADAVWDEDIVATHNNADSAGAILDDLLTPANFMADVSGLATSAEITALNDLSAAEVNAEVDQALLDYDGPTKAEMDLGFTNLNDPTVGEIADAVWDEPLAGHLGVGSAGEALDGASAPTAGEVADAVWDEAQSGHTTVGTFGYYLDSQVSAAGGGSLTAADVADAVWDELRAGHVISGSFGERVLADATHINGGDLAGNNAVLNLNRINVTASGGNPAVKLTGDSGGAGLETNGGVNGHGIQAVGGASGGCGLFAEANSNDHGIESIGEGTGSGLYAHVALGGEGSGIFAQGGQVDPGRGIYAVGGYGHGFEAKGGTLGNGFLSAAGGAAAGMRVVANTGTGLDIDAGTNGDGVNITAGANSGAGIDVTATNDGAMNLYSVNGDGLHIDGALRGIYSVGGQAGAALLGDQAGGRGLWARGFDQAGIEADDQGTNGDGMLLTGKGTGAGLHANAGATGVDVEAELDVNIVDVNGVAVVDIGDFKADVSALATSAEITALNDLSAAEVNAEVDQALLDYDGPTKTELDAGFAALNDPDAAAIADAVWDELQTGHVTVGSFGYYLDSQVSAAGGGSLTAGEIADAVWDEAIADHQGVGSTGEALGGASAPTAADVATAVWDKDLALYVSGTLAGTFLTTLHSAWPELMRYAFGTKFLGVQGILNTSTLNFTGTVPVGSSIVVSRRSININTPSVPGVPELDAPVTLWTIDDTGITINPAWVSPGFADMIELAYSNGGGEIGAETMTITLNSADGGPVVVTLDLPAVSGNQTFYIGSDGKSLIVYPSAGNSRAPRTMIPAPAASADVNVTQWDGSDVLTPIRAGIPRVDAAYLGDEGVATGAGDNFSTFFSNGETATTKTVDDVSSAEDILEYDTSLLPGGVPNDYGVRPVDFVWLAARNTGRLIRGNMMAYEIHATPTVTFSGTFTLDAEIRVEVVVLTDGTSYGRTSTVVGTIDSGGFTVDPGWAAAHALQNRYDSIHLDIRPLTGTISAGVFTISFTGTGGTSDMTFEVNIPDDWASGGSSRNYCYWDVNGNLMDEEGYIGNSVPAVASSDVNVTQWNGVAASGLGIPDVNMFRIAGSSIDGLQVGSNFTNFFHANGQNPALRLDLLDDNMAELRDAAMSAVTAQLLGGRSWDPAGVTITLDGGGIPVGETLTLTRSNLVFNFGYVEPGSEVVMGTIDNTGNFTPDAGWTGAISFDALEIRMSSNGSPMTAGGTLTIQVASNNSDPALNTYTFKLPALGNGRYVYLGAHGDLKMWNNYFGQGEGSLAAAGATPQEVWDYFKARRPTAITYVVGGLANDKVDVITLDDGTQLQHTYNASGKLISITVV